MREAEIIRAEIQERIERMLEPYLERARAAQWEVSAGKTIHEQVAEKFDLDPRDVEESIDLPRAARVSAIIEAILDLQHACDVENIPWQKPYTAAAAMYYTQKNSLYRYLAWRAPDDPDGRPPNTIHMVD